MQILEQCKLCEVRRTLDGSRSNPYWNDPTSKTTETETRASMTGRKAERSFWIYVVVNRKYVESRFIDREDKISSAAKRPEKHTTVIPVNKIVFEIR